MTTHLFHDTPAPVGLEYSFGEVAALAKQGGCELVDLGDEYVLRKWEQGTFHDLISTESLQWLGEQLEVPISATH